MAKSTITVVASAKGGYELRQGRRVIVRVDTRKEARQLMREARAAERAAAKALRSA